MAELAETELLPLPSPTNPVTEGLVALGDWTLFATRAMTGLVSRHLHAREVIAMCVSIGINSLGVVAVSGAFIGMVLAVQSYGQFHQLGLDTSLGAMIHLSLVRELGPVLTAIMLAGRIGSSIAAELSTMRVTEQLDALACLGVDPVQYLVAPRFLACVLMIPLLTVFTDLLGLLGSTLICLRVYDIDSYHYWEHTRAYVGRWDIFVGLTKSLFFGAAIALIACHRGFRGTAGAAGVGRAATQAFVLAFLAILAIDFLCGLMSNRLYDLFWPPVGIRMM